MTIQEKLRGLADGKKYRDVQGFEYLIHCGTLMTYHEAYGHCAIDHEGLAKNWTEIKELDWSADEHDPELIEDLWPVKAWNDHYRYCEDEVFYDKSHNVSIDYENGDRRGSAYDHFRAIPREQWTKWQEEKYNELRERYYGK